MKKIIPFLLLLSVTSCGTLRPAMATYTCAEIKWAMTVLSKERIAEEMKKFPKEECKRLQSLCFPKSKVDRCV